jgi:hypothetical protein
MKRKGREPVLGKLVDRDARLDAADIGLAQDRLNGISRELESAILATDFGIDFLRDGPAENLSQPP